MVIRNDEAPVADRKSGCEVIGSRAARRLVGRDTDYRGLDALDRVRQPVGGSRALGNQQGQKARRGQHLQRLPRALPGVCRKAPEEEGGSLARRAVHGPSPPVDGSSLGQAVPAVVVMR